MTGKKDKTDSEEKDLIEADKFFRKQYAKDKGKAAEGNTKAAIKILQEKYVEGVITKKEFEKMVAGIGIKGKAEDGYRYDYLFYDNGIAIINIISRKKYWGLLIGVLFVISLFTGYFGGIIAFVVAVGIVENVWAGPIRNKYTKLSLKELLSKNGNKLIPWVSISSFEINSNNVKIVINENIYKGKIKTDLDITKKFLVSKLGKRVTVK